MKEYNEEMKNSIELEFIDTKKEILDDKKESLLNNNQINKENIGSVKKIRTDLLYGNDINILQPRKIGKVWAFLYYKDYPLIVIGPGCK